MEEHEFLAKYDPSAFDGPLATVDSVLFTFREGTLQALLVQRNQHPDKGKWGLPGGFIDPVADTDLTATAYRKLQEKTAVAPPYLEQLQTVGNASRDKRGWSLTVCYTALIAYQDCEARIDSVADAAWVDFDSAITMALAFDHNSLLQNARERLKQKALYSIVPAYALPRKFTLPELQHLHEVLIGKPLQKKSFRRRIEQADLLIDTGEKRSEGRRPAKLYQMKKSSGDYTFLRNLEA